MWWQPEGIEFHWNQIILSFECLLNFNSLPFPLPENDQPSIIAPLLALSLSSIRRAVNPLLLQQHHLLSLDEITCLESVEVYA